MTVIIDAVRTPIGRRKGAYREMRPDSLYAIVLNALLERTGVDPAAIEDVITGCVTQAGEQGANIGRLGVLLSKLPQTVPGVTLNRMCGSSQQAIHFAAQVIAAGDADYLIAGGVESMTRVPMFSDIQGGFEVLNPALGEKYNLVHQGESAERIAEAFELSRDALDAFSAESHIRADRAEAEGCYQSQMVPVEGVDGDGNPLTLTRDEGVRRNSSMAQMAGLKTPFRPTGVITAGNSSQISDGAAAVLLASEARAKADGLKPRARFRARVVVAGDPTMQLLEVIPATRKALEKAGLSLGDIDLFEVNEAFSSVAMAWAKTFEVDPAKLNPNGGAIAHGHPLGATGAVLCTKLLNELERRDLQFGLQTMCIGHGMATATVIERV